MTQEQIQMQADKYADKYAKEYGLSDDTAFGMSLGFKAGANWRIESVWHKPDEEPDPLKGYLLVGIKPKDVNKIIYIFQNADYVLQFSCIRWAYIDDLLPEE